MILVTGGTGILGSAVVRELRARGQSVRVLARPESAALARALDIEVAEGDLNDADSLRRAADGATGIVHAACTFFHPDVDIQAMDTLLDAWDRGPFVFISTVDVYGYPQWLPITEEHPLSETHSGYARGKLRCEARLRDTAGARSRTDWSILRPPNIWGPDARALRHRDSPVKRLYMQVRQGEPVTLPGEQQDEWASFGDDWVDTRELAWAAAECLDRPLGDAANVVNGHFTWNDVFTELIRLCGSASRIEHRGPAEGFFAQTWRYSSDRLRQRLGFQPVYRWQDTLAAIVALDS